jgi:hypothetical protein
MRINFWLDVVMAAVLVLMQMPQATGVGLHQVFGFGLATGIAVHLIFHRKWIAAMGRSLPKPLPSVVQVNLLLSALLLVFFSLTCISGLLNSPVSPVAADPNPTRANVASKNSGVETNGGRTERWGTSASPRDGLGRSPGLEHAVFFWHVIHNLSARLTLLIVIAHLVSHRKWIANALKRPTFSASS